MGNFKETAKAYEPKKTPIVSELEVVSLSCPITKESGTDKEGKDFEYFVVNVGGIVYRVPNSVMEAVHTLLEEKPNIKTIKVVKKGEGMNSKYTVLELE
jgi:hypothetical protein